MADITKLENDLWEAADELRANSKLTSQQYCMPVLGLIFLRYAWGRFKRADSELKAERAQREGRAARQPIEPSEYTSKGARSPDTTTFSTSPRPRTPARR